MPAWATMQKPQRLARCRIIRCGVGDRGSARSNAVAPVREQAVTPIGRSVNLVGSTLRRLRRICCTGNQRIAASRTWAWTRMLAVPVGGANGWHSSVTVWLPGGTVHQPSTTIWPTQTSLGAGGTPTVMEPTN